MISNYIKVLIRNLLKYKGFSAINIIGLAIGITGCIAILLFVRDELSYDKFNEKYDRIFRVNIDIALGNTKAKQSVTSAPLAETMMRDFPEVENVVRIRKSGSPVLRYKDKIFSEDKFFRVDSTIFDIFTIPFLAGNPKTALTKPKSLVITRTMAKKYFGDDDPMGKTLNSDNRDDFTITGVIEDCPVNSHWHYDFLVSLSSFSESRNPFWLNNNFQTYVLLKDKNSWKNLNAKINQGFEKYIAPQILQFTGIPWEQHKQKGAGLNYFLMPLADIHLHSNFDYDLEPNSDITYIYVFSIIAIGILFIACFNFMNLSTARALRRAKEVGIRKTLGSSFNQLIKQFLAESIMICIIAVVIAVVLVNLLLPLLNDISGKTIHLGIIDNLSLIPFLILFVFIVGVAAGSYPAFFLASFKPVSVLSGKLKYGSKGKFFRNSLVIAQFVISITLLIGTIVVYLQLHFIQTKKLGYNKEQVVIVHKVDDIGRSINAFKEELLKNPNIIKTSNSSALPGSGGYNNNGYLISRSGAEGVRLLMTMRADYDYLDTYQIQTSLGRYFLRDHMVDTLNSVVINEAAVKELGFNDPLEREIIVPDNPPIAMKIIGVMKDYHYESLHAEIRPLIIMLLKPQRFGVYLSARISSENISGTLDYMKKTWSKFAGEQAFEYTFHDEDFAKLYQSEQRTGKLFAVFSIFGIFIACLGLFGLASHTAERRRREIGIRRALGSSTNAIIYLLSKEFARRVLIANIIAWPIGYFLMNKWLQNFAYRTDLNVWIFIISGFVALIVALMTVIYQSVKAAGANPVESLKYE